VEGLLFLVFLYCLAFQRTLYICVLLVDTV
jgi:hypothetical protein